MNHELSQLIAAAQLNYQKFESEACLQNAEKIITLAASTGNQPSLGFGHFYKGTALWELKNLPEAMENLTAAVAIARHCGEETLLAKTFYVMGCFYREVGMSSRALEYLDDSTVIYETLHARDSSNKEWQLGIGRNLTICGQTLLMTKQFDKAEHYNLRALAIRQNIGYEWGIATSKSNLAFVYLQTKQYQRARLLFTEAIDTVKLMDNQFHYYLALVGLAQVQVALHENDRATENLEFLYQKTKDDPAFASVYNDVLNHLSQLYAAGGRFEQAYKLAHEYANHRNAEFSHAYVDAITLLEAEQGKAKREQQLQESRHNNLKLTLTSMRSQMDPHFIFNLLHSISNRIETNSNTEAKNIIERFALLMRQNLELAINESITLEDEIDFLLNYMELEQLRMAHKFAFVIDVDENLETAFIHLPGMLIQPYIENAIKHGLALKEENGTLEVIFKLVNDNTLQCLVRDNGIGRSAAQKLNTGKKELSDKKFESRGMSITDNRISTLNALDHGKISVAINDIASPTQLTGTEVLITIKI